MPLEDLGFMDTLYVLGLDLRTSREDPPDPVAEACRWLHYELQKRARLREEARLAMLRAPSTSRRLDIR